MRLWEIQKWFEANRLRDITKILKLYTKALRAQWRVITTKITNIISSKHKPIAMNNSHKNKESQTQILQSKNHTLHKQEPQSQRAWWGWTKEEDESVTKGPLWSPLCVGVGGTKSAHGCPH